MCEPLMIFLINLQIWDYCCWFMIGILVFVFIASKSSWFKILQHRAFKKAKQMIYFFWMGVNIWKFSLLQYLEVAWSIAISHDDIIIKTVLLLIIMFCDYRLLLKQIHNKEPRDTFIILHDHNVLSNTWPSMEHWHTFHPSFDGTSQKQN